MIFYKLVEWFGMVLEDMWNIDKKKFRIYYGKA